MRDAWSGDDQRHVHAAAFIEVLFAEEAVFPERKPVVAREDDHRVLPLSGLLQRGEDAADVMVESGDASVVVGGLPACVLRRPRPGGEAFVADGHLAVVPRMDGPEGGRKRHLRGVIHRVEARFGRARVMWHGWSQVGIERSTILAAGVLLQEGDRPVGEPKARVGAVGGRVGRRFGVVEDVRLERLQPFGEGIATLAHVPGTIAGSGQHAGQEGLRLRCPGAGVLRARDALPGPAGQHHRAAGRADRADHGALGVGARESGPASDELVEVRGDQPGCTERTQAVGPVVVGVDVEDVRPRRRELGG